MMIKSPVESLYCEYSYIYGEEVDDGCDLTRQFRKRREIPHRRGDRLFPQSAALAWCTASKGTATVADWDLSGGMTRVLVREDKKSRRASKRGQRIHPYHGAERRPFGRTSRSRFPIVHAEPFAFYKNFAAACAGKAEKPAIRREEVVRVYKLMEAAERSARGKYRH